MSITTNAVSSARTLIGSGRAGRVTMRASLVPVVSTVWFATAFLIFAYDVNHMRGHRQGATFGRRRAGAATEIDRARAPADRAGSEPASLSALSGMSGDPIRLKAFGVNRPAAFQV
jgi:hypothetical protein